MIGFSLDFNLLNRRHLQNDDISIGLAFLRQLWTAMKSRSYRTGIRHNARKGGTR